MLVFIDEDFELENAGNDAGEVILYEVKSILNRSFHITLE